MQQQVLSTYVNTQKYTRKADTCHDVVFNFRAVVKDMTLIVDTLLSNTKEDDPVATMFQRPEGQPLNIQELSDVTKATQRRKREVMTIQPFSRLSSVSAPHQSQLNPHSFGLGKYSNSDNSEIIEPTLGSHGNPTPGPFTAMFGTSGLALDKIFHKFNQNSPPKFINPSIIQDVKDLPPSPGFAKFIEDAKAAEALNSDNGRNNNNHNRHSRRSADPNSAADTITSWASRIAGLSITGGPMFNIWNLPIWSGLNDTQKPGGSDVAGPHGLAPASQVLGGADVAGLRDQAPAFEEDTTTTTTTGSPRTEAAEPLAQAPTTRDYEQLMEDEHRERTRYSHISGLQHGIITGYSPVTGEKITPRTVFMNPNFLPPWLDWSPINNTEVEATSLQVNTTQEPRTARFLTVPAAIVAPALAVPAILELIYQLTNKPHPVANTNTGVSGESRGASTRTRSTTPSRTRSAGRPFTTATSWAASGAKGANSGRTPARSPSSIHQERLQRGRPPNDLHSSLAAPTTSAASARPTGTTTRPLGTSLRKIHGK